MYKCSFGVCIWCREPPRRIWYIAFNQRFSRIFPQRRRLISRLCARIFFSLRRTKAGCTALFFVRLHSWLGSFSCPTLHATLPAGPLGLQETLAAVRTSSTSQVIIENGRFSRALHHTPPRIPWGCERFFLSRESSKITINLGRTTKAGYREVRSSMYPSISPQVSLPAMVKL